MNKKESIIKKIILRDSENGPKVIIEKENQSNEYSLINAISIHRCNEFLRSLGTGLEIKFDNFKQYNHLLRNIANKLNAQYLFLA